MFAHGEKSETVTRRNATYDLHPVKGKAVPLQAWSGQESSWKLKFPDFMTMA